MSETEAVKPLTIAIMRYKGGLCILPMVQIILGAQSLDDCPLQPKIPIYLVLMGIYMLLMIGLSYLPHCFNKKSWLRIVFIVCSIVFFIFFIAGNVWIFSINEPPYRKGSKLHCGRVIYTFAFWATIGTWIQVAIITSCCICCHVLCKDDEETQQVIPEQTNTQTQ